MRRAMSRPSLVAGVWIELDMNELLIASMSCSDMYTHVWLVAGP